MSTEFWAGLLTLPALAIALFITVMVYAAMTRVWRMLHTASLARVVLTKDPANPYGEPSPSPYQKSIDRFAENLAQSPRLWMFEGLGLMVTVVRDYKIVDSPDTGTAATDLKEGI